MEQVKIRLDVTQAAGLGEPAEIAATLHLPYPASVGHTRPIVAFAKPGGGFNRHYFTEDLPGPAAGAQAAWHASRGWVFASIDHLGVGDSSAHEMRRLDYGTVANASHAAEQQILVRLREGGISSHLPPLHDPIRLGLGQSMGGCLTVYQQAHHRSYDGIAVLGYSALHSRIATPPGTPPAVQRWVPRDRLTSILNQQRFESPGNEFGRRDLRSLSHWMFYFDDVDTEAFTDADDQPWRSATYPGIISSCLTPSVVASEAAAIETPVLVAMGERDVVADPFGEPRAYLSAPSVDIFTCPRMGHMHNFAGTRELFWQRIATWAEWVVAHTA